MARRSDAVPTRVKGFADYYASAASAATILASFDYSLRVEVLTLPRYSGDVPWIASLQQRFLRLIPLLALDTEMARREFLIAPILADIALQFNVQIHSEQAVNVSEALRGSFDYLAEREGNVVIIEAKLGDMERGFRQLAAELVALDRWTDSEASLLYGAVTVGDAWRFAVLERESRTITQDIGLYPVPDRLENVVRALVAMVTGITE